MTDNEALELAESTLADGLITAAVENVEFWHCLTFALKKRVQVRPDKNRLKYFCPVCIAERVEVGQIHKSGITIKKNYCSRCGQAINWEGIK